MEYPKSHDYPGALVVFEGGEGTGKSTQVRKLGETLERSGYAPEIGERRVGKEC